MKFAWVTPVREEGPPHRDKPKVLIMINHNRRTTCQEAAARPIFPKSGANRALRRAPG